MYLCLKSSPEITMTALYSHLFKEEFVEKNAFWTRVIYSVIWPVTIYFLIKLISENTLNFKQFNFQFMLKKVIQIILVVALIGLVSRGITVIVTTYNKSVDIELSLQKHLNGRLSILDKMNKVLHQKLQIAGINDSSYYKNLNAITMMRKDGEQVTWKWVVENNPNANYGEVSALYRELSQAIDGERTALLQQESECQQDVLDYAILHKQFPTNLYLFWQAKNLEYNPISSSANRETNKSGIDNNISL